MTADPVQIARRLRAAEPRAAQTLILRFVDGRSREDCARAFGIGLDAFDVKLWRALQSYRGSPSPAPFAEEQTQANALALGEPPPELEELRDHAAAIRQALDDAARAYEASPERRREDWIRRAIIVAIVLATAWFGRETLVQWIDNSLKWLHGKA